MLSVSLKKQKDRSKIYSGMIPQFSTAQRLQTMRRWFTPTLLQPQHPTPSVNYSESEQCWGVLPFISSKESCTSSKRLGLGQEPTTSMALPQLLLVIFCIHIYLPISKDVYARLGTRERKTRKSLETASSEGSRKAALKTGLKRNLGKKRTKDILLQTLLVH